LVLRVPTGFNGDMLTEEALILLATLTASGLLVLGVMELVWPTTPRRPARRARPTLPTRPTPEAMVGPWEAFHALPEMPSPPAPVEGIEPVFAAVEAPPPANAPDPVAAPPPPRRPTPTHRSSRAPRSSDWRSAEAPAPAVVERPPMIAASVSAPPATAEPAPAVVPPVEPAVPVLAVEPVVAAASTTRRESKPSVLPIDTCLAMYRERRFAEVVSLGSAALEVNARMASVSERHDEAAALFDLVGLSKQELGDRDGARAAFRAAVREAEPQVRPTYVRHLIILARSVVDPIVAAGATAEGDEAAAQVRELRACAVALEDAVSVVPGDEGLGSASAAVREALSPACERLVARVVSGEGDDQARELVLEALADEAMPTAWRERLREQLIAASSAEIGQLTAQAIRSVQDGKDGEALAALERAERLSAALPSGSVEDERREEFERRLWWGYTKVGLRRVETKKFEDALEPLFRALRLGGIDEERLGETRAALVRALDGLIDAKWPAIQMLATEDVPAAQGEVERLLALLRSSNERGLSRDDLGEAFAKVLHLGQTLSQAPS
jgi:hypothetical protein